MYVTTVAVEAAVIRRPSAWNQASQFELVRLGLSDLERTVRRTCERRSVKGATKQGVRR